MNKSFLLGGLCFSAATIGVFLWKGNKPVSILCFIVAAVIAVVAGVLPA